MAKIGVDLADIIRNNREEFSNSRSLTNKQNRVLSSITYCRTERLGYHLDQCPECKHREIAYNSCRDRHCPKCQGIAQRKWVDKRCNQLLPVPYYHVVFTLPPGLFPFSLYNKRLIYNLLFDSAAATLKQFGEDPKWLGGKIGFFGILHTWGQTLWHHPHVHFIVAGGAQSKHGKWIQPKHKGKFLFPVHGLSKVFRGKFMKSLESAIKADDYTLPEDCTVHNTTWNSKRFLRSLVEKDWIVYCKSPMKNAKDVVRYIGRYTHRVAISNNRILDYKHGRVTFSYRDYKDQNQKKDMNLSGCDFLQRFLWHVLPEQFHRIRHYGFLANGSVKKTLRDLQETLCLGVVKKVKKSALDGNVCKNCGAGIMVLLQLITATGYLITPRGSPLLDSS